MDFSWPFGLLDGLVTGLDDPGTSNEDSSGVCTSIEEVEAEVVLEGLISPSMLSHPSRGYGRSGTEHSPSPHVCAMLRVGHCVELDAVIETDDE